MRMRMITVMLPLEDDLLIIFSSRFTCALCVHHDGVAPPHPSFNFQSPLAPPPPPPPPCFRHSHVTLLLLLLPISSLMPRLPPPYYLFLPPSPSLLASRFSLLLPLSALLPNFLFSPSSVLCLPSSPFLPHAASILPRPPPSVPAQS